MYKKYIPTRNLSAFAPGNQLSISVTLLRYRTKRLMDSSRLFVLWDLLDGNHISDKRKLTVIYFVEASWLQQFAQRKSKYQLRSLTKIFKFSYIYLTTVVLNKTYAFKSQ